jgi:PKD repeat protein
LSASGGDLVNRSITLNRCFLLFVLAAFACLSIVASPAVAADLEQSTGSSASPFIRPDDAALRDWVADHEQAPVAPSPPLRRGRALSPTAVNLLPFVPYVASERDQGSAGTCWVWAGTGILEVAHLFGNGISDRLSIQYFDSNFNGGSGPDWAGNGGTLDDFTRFYDGGRTAVPWSNTNASYVDGDVRSVIEERALMDASLIETIPNYTIGSVQDLRVATRGVEQAQAIANIKAQLNDNRPLFVGLAFPNGTAVQDFLALWYQQGESAVWDPTPYDGTPWDENNGALHAVLCVGYDESDPENPYWIMLNSMGTASGGRPNGIFRMRMDLDYDAVYVHDYPVYPAQWGTLSVSFVVPTPTPTPTTKPLVPFPGGVGVPTDPGGIGKCEDVNGNGRKDFADAVLLFNQLEWCAENEPLVLFDMNGNGRMDFADVVILFNRL